MTTRTFCPKCEHIVLVNKYGFIECNRCGCFFIVNKKDGWIMVFSDRIGEIRSLVKLPDSSYEFVGGS